MKTPKPVKLPSGNYFVRMRLNGVSIPITAPTAKECTAKAEAIKSQHNIGNDDLIRKKYTVEEAIDKYIKSRGVISPSTLRGYYQIKNRFKPYFSQKLSKVDWSEVIKELDAKYAPKTVHNSWGFMRSVFLHIKETPPDVNTQIVPESDLPFLEPEQIITFLDLIKDTDIEIPSLLALHSLRRSEVAHISRNDFNFKRNSFAVNGSMVYNEKNELVSKNIGKNKKSSKREIPIMIPRLAELMKNLDTDEYIWTLAPCTITNKINKICRANGLPEVGCQGLRRSFASLAYHLGWSEAYTMEIGGWSDPKIMRKIYIKLAQKDRLKQSNSMTDFYKNANETPMVTQETA